MKDNKIKAVYDDDLESLLQSLGVYEKVINGEINCETCGITITMDNVGLLVPIEGRVGIICDRDECQTKVSRE